jgi:two-component system, NarL family, response regulator DegU
MTNTDQAYSGSITVLIAEDNPIYRDGLCDLMAHWDSFKVTGLAGNGAEAVEMYRECRPDIVLMDVDMPVMTGAEATQQILQEFPGARIVMMSVTTDDLKLLEAIQSGACGYVLKDVSCHQLQHLLMGWAAREKRRG